MSLKILGIDPGSRITGYALLEIQSGKVVYLESGILDLIRTETLFTHRLRLLGENLENLLRRFKPHHVAIEKIFLGKNADSAFKLGHARGVVLYEALCAGAHIFEYSTREVKKGITGRGSAEKEEVQAVLKSFLKLPQLRSLDESDALALAYYHSQKKQSEHLWRRAIEI